MRTFRRKPNTIRATQFRVYEAWPTGVGLNHNGQPCVFVPVWADKRGGRSTLHQVCDGDWIVYDENDEPVGCMRDDHLRANYDEVPVVTWAPRDDDNVGG